MMALFPPSSRMVRPKRLCTAVEMRVPTEVEPVKETSERRLSPRNSSPMARPAPTIVEATAPLILCSASASATTRVVASVTSEVEVAPSQMLTLPQMRERVMFQPYTAHGKLKAVIMPTIPSGCQCSWIT
eukprot:Mycagemm_TRINITY_DN10314_c3_g8::TRINITY_DN10314_c3_g8_i1::g.580::m.580 type:complete len:130 gc:universal TRINITY_DN10314_c3_g8_i1:578-967(+)